MTARRTSRRISVLRRRLVLLAGCWPVSAPLALFVLLASWAGRLPALLLLAATSGAGVTWRSRHRRSFARLVGDHAGACVRRQLVYRWRWASAMDLTGLARRAGDVEYAPTLRRVRCGPVVDELHVAMTHGQCPEQYEAVARHLAHTFGALSCRVRSDRPGRLTLDLVHRDALTVPVPALPVPDVVDLAAVPVGVTEEPGGIWTVPLLGSHVLVAGATGSGKGSVLWSLVRGLAGEIHAGRVQVWALDPKGGMELNLGAALFARFAYDDLPAMVDLLEDAVAVMRQRAARLRQARSRQHTPSVEEPLIVVLVDELAALTAYVTDRELRRRADAALQLLLSQGRAPGVLVVAAAQDPGKDVVTFRDLFPVRVGLRLVEDVQVDMALGRGARARGADCDRIPPALPGVGFVLRDGTRDPIRVRAGHVTDADLADLCARYPVPPTRATQERAA